MIVVKRCPLIGLIQYDNVDRDNNKIAQSNFSSGRTSPIRKTATRL